jgi:hypothetical protein
VGARAITIFALGVAAAAAAALALADDSSGPRPSKGAAAVAGPATPVSSVATRFGGAREDCRTRSEANFPGAFTSSSNLVVGPLVLIGGAQTPASTVRDFGGNKFPLLVKSGHAVTVRVARRAREAAGLAYGPLPQQRETQLRDTHRSVAFVACRPGRATGDYDPDGPSGSSADGVAVTFWSGFVLTRAPACIPLEVYVDGSAAPQRVGLPLGRQCA